MRYDLRLDEDMTTYNRCNSVTRDDPMYPIELDTYVLMPDPDATNEAILAHDRFDPPGTPLILSNIHQFC